MARNSSSFWSSASGWNWTVKQFHPEANGGPKDTEFLFDRFLNNVKAAKKEAR